MNETRSPAPRRLLAAGLLALCSVMVAANGMRERGQESMGNPPDWQQVRLNDAVTATGIVGVYGSEPHTYLAIAVPDETRPSGVRLIEIAGELIVEIRELQNRTVSATGILTRLETGPGFPAAIDVTRYSEVEQ
jgi:hypothetical protein